MTIQEPFEKYVRSHVTNDGPCSPQADVEPGKSPFESKVLVTGHFSYCMMFYVG